MSRSVESYLLDIPGAIEINDPTRLAYERIGYQTPQFIIDFELSQGRERLESALTVEQEPQDEVVASR